MEDTLKRLGSRVVELYDRHWRLGLVLLWLAYAGSALAGGWNKVRYFILTDTDDNLRMAQVRAWLDGQGWFDLVQHRFDPVHGGANIHWSRLVDLPLAGLISLFRPFVGNAEAERLAAGIAPLIPLLLLMFALALITRRLVHKKAWILPLIALMFAPSAWGMFQPMRIDHHGWQLALLATALSGMADPKRRRGGVVTGIATGLSLVIGMEMVIYLAVLGIATVLMWVADRDERSRLVGYAAALGASTSIGFLLFASYANRAPVCDALSPVWLADALLAAALLVGLSRVRSERWAVRLGVALVAGVAVAAFHALAWPQCLSRLEGVSDEANQLWLSHVREARPFYRHGWRIALVAMTLPVTALLGWALLAWKARRERDEHPTRLARTLAVATPSIVALALLFWQMRAAPAAQVMAAPGAIALAALFVHRWLNSEKMWLHVVAVVTLLLGLGALIPTVVSLWPREPSTPIGKKVAAANSKCPSLPALAPVGRQPQGVVFSFVDLGPRLINVTHHSAIAGPYHRNGRAIADVMKAFRGDEANARRIIDAYGSDYVLVCPYMSTATIFMKEAPKGFYVQISSGRAPAWLRPVDLGEGSPLMMWKVVR